jgi:predicted N-acetyltransferase YhbS
MQSPANFFHFSHTILRDVQDSDVDQLVSLINEAYSYQDDAKGAPRTNLEHLRKRISETRMYVIESNNKVIGCVYLEPHDKSLHFGLLTVAPIFRGTGLAQAIMTSVEKYATNNHYEALELDYMSLAPWLKDYYERYKFATTGQSTAWGSIDLIRMRKTI